MITYKGYNINVDYEPSSPKNCCYVAYICDSNGHHEHTRGESKGDAIKFLQQKIDNYKVFNELYLKPLDSNELQQLKEYIIANSSTIVRLLKREHYIAPNRFPCFSFRAIYNHHKDIQETLKFCGENVNIDIAMIKHNDIVEKVVLFNVDYYKNKRDELENELYNLN